MKASIGFRFQSFPSAELNWLLIEFNEKLKKSCIVSWKIYLLWLHFIQSDRLNRIDFCLVSTYIYITRNPWIMLCQMILFPIECLFNAALKCRNSMAEYRFFRKSGVNILQKEEDFVWAIFRVLQGRIPTKFNYVNKKN